MKISFDLDDTLIPSGPDDFPCIRRTLVHKLFSIERLRVDCKSVFDQLQSQGHEVGIYTTSHRSFLKVFIQFFTYGIKVDFVINEKTNEMTLKREHIFASKYPPAFNIHLHIDDSLGVAMEGQRLGFETLVIAKTDDDWPKQVIKKVNRMMNPFID